MKKKCRHVTDAELAILRLLWDSDSLTATQIREAVYPRGTHSDHSTVQKLLERLEAKGCIKRDRSSFAHVITATSGRTEFAGQELVQLAEKFWDGSLAPVVIHLVESKRLTKRERETIRRLLDYD